MYFRYCAAFGRVTPTPRAPFSRPAGNARRHGGTSLSQPVRLDSLVTALPAVAEPVLSTFPEPHLRRGPAPRATAPRGELPAWLARLPVGLLRPFRSAEDPSARSLDQELRAGGAGQQAAGRETGPSLSAQGRGCRAGLLRNDVTSECRQASQPNHGRRRAKCQQMPDACRGSRRNGYF